MKVKQQPAEAPVKAAILAKALIRAGDNLKLTNRVLGHVVGLSESSVSRMRGGSAHLLDNNPKAFELAALFVRLFRSLDAIAGGDDAVASQWLNNEHTLLRDRPINLIQTARGLVRVIDYLDARRAPL